MNVTLADKAAIADATSKKKRKTGDGASPFYLRTSADTIRGCLAHELALGTVNDYSKNCEDFKDVSLTHVRSAGKQLRCKGQMWDLSSVAVGNLASFGGRALVQKYKNSSVNPGVRALRAYHDARDDPMSSDIFDMIANDMLQHMAVRSKALIRVFMLGEEYDIGKVRRIDALLTSRYGIIDNQWLLNNIGGLAKGVWANFWFKGRVVSGRYLIADEARTEEAEYAATLAIRNAEDGRASLTIRPSVHDWISGGGVIFGGLEGEVLKRVHRGDIDALQLRSAMKTHINEQIPLFDSCIQHIEDLKQIAVEKDKLKGLLYDIGDREGLTLDERVEWLKAIEVELATRCEKLGLSAYAVVMGLARVSGASEDDSRANDMSTIAGRLAMPKGGTLAKLWMRLHDRSLSADAEKVMATFGNK